MEFVRSRCKRVDAVMCLPGEVNKTAQNVRLCRVTVADETGMHGGIGATLCPLHHVGRRLVRTSTVYMRLNVPSCVGSIYSTLYDPYIDPVNPVPLSLSTLLPTCHIPDSTCTRAVMLRA